MPDDHDLSLRDLADRIADLTRVVTRQAGTIDELLEDNRARAARDRAGADAPLLVDLLGLRSDAAACAATARTRRERSAFSALAAGLDRLIAGRGGQVVEPTPGTAFDAAQMDAVEVAKTDDRALDRTVADVVEPGLRLTDSGRCLRPARVVVHRHVEAAGP